MKRIITTVLGLAVIAGFAPTLWNLAVARAAESAPQVEFYMTDTGENSPSLPSQCASAEQRFGWGSYVHDTINNDNSDCAKIRIANPSATYTNDFRLCFYVDSGMGPGEGEQCTAWASEGGSATGLLQSRSDYAIGAMNVRVEQRALAGGGHIEGTRVGIQWYELPDRGSCGASGGMQYAYASGGSAESGWTYGGSNDNDPGCARFELQTTYVAPYDAALAGTNISGSELTPNTTYDASRNMRIVMRDEGHSWESDQQVREVGDCSGFDPGPGVPDCQSTKVLTSSNIKLSRLDSEPFVFNPAILSYEREVTVTHHAVSDQQCVQWSMRGGATPVAIEKGKTGTFGIPVAYARAIDPEPGDDPVCTEWETVWYDQVSESPVRSVITPDTATFPAVFTTPAAGNYTLRFQMQKTDGAAPGTDSEGRFGDIVEIPVTVAGSGAGIGISCPVAEATVRAGEVASYAVTIASQGGFAGDVTVTPSGMPAGATSPGATVTVAASSSASGIVAITTASSTPAGTSTITFTGAATGVSPATCTSLLIVQNDGPSLTLQPASQDILVGGTASYQALYDADGGGPGGSTDVTASAAWSVTGPATNLGNGSFRGDDAGTATPRATYLGLSAPATLNIANGPAATLEVRPGSASVSVGSQVGLDAYYDPDGAGPLAEQTVTAIATWSSTNSGVATSLGVGVFQGNATGTAQARASYNSKTDDADLSVTSLGGACSFSAAPATLFIPPLRPTTLSWNCSQPTSCRVTVSNTPRAGTQVATGGQSGSGVDQPPYSTTYHLSCDDGSQADATVRVFDVTTRIEILPQ